MTRPPSTANEWEKLRSAYDEYYNPLDRGIFEDIGSQMRARGHATIDDLSRIAFWKFGSWRNYNAITSQANRRKVERLTGMVFELDESEVVKQVSLLAWEDSGLDGFGIPMASALLCVFDPEHYAVLDRYAWRTYTILALGKPSPKSSFTPADYGRFVTFCRTRRKSLPGWTTRDIEKVLFLWGEQQD